MRPRAAGVQSDVLLPARGRTPWPCVTSRSYVVARGLLKPKFVLICPHVPPGKTCASGFWRLQGITNVPVESSRIGPV